MKIARLLWTTYRLPFRAPYLTAQGIVRHREGILLELTTDAGIVGYGEAALLPHDTGIDALKASVQELAALARGTKVEGWLAAKDQDNRPALTALCCAAADAYSRYQGLSLAQLIATATGGGVSPLVTVNALISGEDANAVSDAAAKARRQGYGTVKLKVGFAPSLDEEMNRVAAAREALGPEIKLRIDANGAWEPEQAIDNLRAIAPYVIEYAEQPVAPGNLQGLELVRRALAPVVEVPELAPARAPVNITSTVGMRIASDEDVTGIASMRQVIEAKAADVFVIKAMQAGGFNDWPAMLKLARPNAVITTSIDAGIGTALALHLAASSGGEYAHGLATLDLLEDDLIEHGLPVLDGAIALPEGAGLGVRPDEEALARYTDGWHDVEP